MRAGFHRLPAQHCAMELVLRHSNRGSLRRIRLPCMEIRKPAFVEQAAQQAQIGCGTGRNESHNVQYVCFCGS
jgi:hypothetical protein